MRLGARNRQRPADRDERGGESRGHRRPHRRSARASRPIGAAASRHELVRQPDPEVSRAREAGGPIDRAAYGCECGYQFSAPVSTSVRCPHCGCAQAW